MTPPQEKFARLVAEGMDKAKAYREAYPKSRRWTNEAVATRAHRLARDAHILPIIEKLRKAADNETQMRIEEARGMLAAQAREIRAKHGSAADLCRTIDSLARISGWNAPEAVLAAAVVISPEERQRRVREALGIPEGAIP